MTEIENALETCDPEIEECTDEDSSIINTVGTPTLQWLTIIYMI